MIELDKIDDIKEGQYICITQDDNYFDGYILDIIDSEDGALTLIMSHTGDFEEDTVEIFYDQESQEILNKDSIYLIDN